MPWTGGAPPEVGLKSGLHSTVGRKGRHEGRVELNLTDAKKHLASVSNLLTVQGLETILSESVPFFQVSPWTVFFFFFFPFPMASHCPLKLKFREPWPCWGADLCGPDSIWTCFSSSILYCLTKISGFRPERREREAGGLSSAYALTPSIQVSSQPGRGSGC